MIDHHTASETFMKHIENEVRWYFFALILILSYSRGETNQLVVFETVFLGKIPDAKTFFDKHVAEILLKYSMKYQFP